MKRLLFLLPVLLMACGTQQKTANGVLQQKTAEEEAAVKEPVKEKAAQMYAEEETAAGEQAKEKAAAVDERIPGGITQESYDQVFNEVKAFIENLNIVIRNKNYSKWRDALSKERLDEISSPEFLADVSKTNSMKRRGIVLKTVYGYFLYVVVP
jgi:Zn-dependent M32 family carboxypeptidase